MSEPKFLKLWTLPDCYMGEKWYDYYVVLGQHRDSDSLSRSNFTCAHKILKDIVNAHPDWDWPNDAPLLVNPYESHWAVGHIEWLGIHKHAPQELIDAADKILADIDDYPCLNETHWSDLQFNEANDYWDSLPIQCRLKDFIQPAGIRCFAARHDLGTIMHEYDSRADHIYESLTND